MTPANLQNTASEEFEFRSSSPSSLCQIGVRIGNHQNIQVLRDAASNSKARLRCKSLGKFSRYWLPANRRLKFAREANPLPAKAICICILGCNGNAVCRGQLGSGRFEYGV